MTTAPKARVVSYQDDTVEDTFRHMPEASEDEELEAAPPVLLEDRPRKPAVLKLVSARVRSGNGAYSEWMNEIKVYLLPNFRHRNVVPAYHVRDIAQGARARADKLLDELVTRVPNKESDRTSAWIYEYKIMTKCQNMTTTLRSYLIQNTLAWAELLKLAIGIMSGLEYLHENHLYTTSAAYKDYAVDQFIQATKGLLRPLKRKSKVYACDPVYTVAIIHRDLSSNNILLTDNLIPKISNFGSAYICYPMQPTNGVQWISGRTKNRFASSVYSAPEVLEGRAELNLVALKAIDMYASGILLWELLSRCILPTIQPPTSNTLKQKRSNPRRYERPYVDLVEDELKPEKLRMFVTVSHIRPTVQTYWTLGRKTNKFCQIFQELWDNDFEARPRSANVLQRLRRLGPADRDKLNHSRYRTNIKKPEFLTNQR